MNGIALIGLLAGCLTTIAYVPQIIKSHKSRRLRDIAIGTYVLLFAGSVSWLTYGLFIHDMPLIIANILGVLFSFYMLLLKFRHG